MLNWLKRSLGGLLALCMLISLVPTALAADRSELEDHWASESLTYFADQGWLQGYKDGTYKPDSKISRAEFITILNRVCGFTERNDEAAKAFQDVKETDWYFEQVSIALAAGYTNGTSATTMSPNAKITRQEAFTMIARVAGVSSENVTVLDTFGDANDIGKFAKPAIAGLTIQGYVGGYTDGCLRPKRNISRAEAVKTMYSCLDLLTGKEQIKDMPAQAAEDNQSIVKADGATDEAFAAYVSAISCVNVNGTDFAITGKNGAKVIKEDGTIDFTTAPFKAEAKDGAYVLTITATGYEKTLTVTVPATYYLYASMTYEEYWNGEGVYAADNTASSEEVDSRGEYDKGGYDAVTRATSNHGLHRGSFQQDVTIHTESGKDYYPLYWIDANNFVDREDGEVYNKTEIGIKSYNITGIKYVPVAVRAQDYAQFVKDYEVTLNGETMYGGYTEGKLKGYTAVAEVTANTNGLKAATLTDGKWSFGARQTGTDSGLKDQALTTAEGTEGAVKTYSGQFGEFLRFDINGNYGGLGSAMQTVKWTYYGTDSTYTTPVATYGTKFAADDWMHKSMGIQLGLTDSIRCQLPEGTDGTGYWTITVYGLGYADHTEKFEVTADNLPTKVAPMTDEQKTQLTALKDQAGEILAQYDDATIKATPALAALKEHYDEAVALLANPDATEPEAAELLTELPALIEAAKPQSVTYTGTSTTKPDEDGDFTAYTLTAKVTVEGGKITAITAQGGGDENAKYLGWAISGRTKGGKDYVGVPAQLIGKTVDEVTALSTIDAVSGATCSSTSILEAVQNALKNPAA